MPREIVGVYEGRPFCLPDGWTVVEGMARWSVSCADDPLPGEDGYEEMTSRMRHEYVEPCPVPLRMIFVQGARAAQ